ncbi:hypothetical protein EV146_12619 [Mesobacillus foraminis]|uniref:Uncharacterized protein n=1 Tax=Mesobacillus foraminis TaxID=279826 RepID=A0A4R2ATW3_9BACI|nr:hypothetical protein EV146_12619 [Mesobacillus foraminis]
MKGRPGAVGLSRPALFGLAQDVLTSAFATGCGIN